ncbi:MULTISPECIES: MFS transporter [unclassified Crossiella]|uniref:MFS transporter n=1 Tax=unclassified Crossiella TaxID=2620835 RepID=UPI001FFE807D|nr:MULTISPECIES: MFS transporter [unclassified Crossiella]MCK2243251.1 MHS family MFS transporter [Crossiella sp. S99.2]MCK2254280.1 MHS family MFS transporter [Crossiella sp. S99.1]
MHNQRSLIRAFTASLSGTALEWYDFAIYSSSAALVFGALFFPSHDPLSGTLLAFSTYAVGYLSRPLGGFVFGRLGDVIGRKKVLVITLMITGVATFAIGLLPTHDDIGVTAAVLLVVLRFAQGVGLGGEWGGAVLLSSEFGDPARRGFWASAAQVGPPLGTLLANGVIALLGVSMSAEDFLAWGWRVAFLLSAVLVLFGLWIRARLEETPVFQAIADSGERPTAPITEVFTTQRRALIAAVLCRVCPDVLYALFAVFVLTYATQELGVPRGWALAAVLIGSAVQVFLIPLAGALSDRWGRRRMYAIATVAAMAWPFVFFPLAETRSLPALIFGVLGGLVIHSALFGPQAAFISEQFTPRLRYTGSSLAYTLAGVIGGAIAPLLFTYLLAEYHDWLALAAYLGLTGVITLIGVALGRDPDPAEEQLTPPAAASASPADGS